MICNGITPVLVGNVTRVHILTENRYTRTQFSRNRHDKHFRITSCLLSKSTPVGERGSVLLPYRPNFRCHFQKLWWFLLMFVLFQRWHKKVEINIPIFMRREPAMRADILLDAVILNITSKPLNMQSYTGLLTWDMKGLILWNRETQKLCLKVHPGMLSWWRPCRLGNACSAQDSVCRCACLFLQILIQLSVTLVLTRASERNRWRSAGHRTSSREAD